MRTGVPIVIRGAMLTSSTVPFPDTGEMAIAEQPYVKGATVSHLIGDLYHKFECKADVTVSFSDPLTMPQAYPGDEANEYWLDLDAVNKYAMFQLENNTQTVTATSPLIVEVNPGGMVGEIALGDVIADSVTVDVYDSMSVLVRTETINLLDKKDTDWYTWTFQTFRQVPNTLFSDLPTNPAYTFKLTFRRSVGNIHVGAVVPKVPFDIGSVQYKAKVRRKNFTEITREFDGKKTRILPRPNEPVLDLVLHIKKGSLNRVRQMLDQDLNGVITSWSGLVETADGYWESLFLIGVCMDVEYSLDNPDDLLADIKLEGF